MLVDLHTHSLASDGTQTPAELIARAAAAGLDVVALTDHDSMAGWAEATDAARRHRIALVPGIEISCRHEGISVHLLGYLLDPHHQPLLRELTKARDSRDSRARGIVEALAEDLPLTFADVAAQAAPGATLGRPHIADAMVARGIVADREEAFREWLHSRSKYYLRYAAVDVLQAVRLIRAAGGVSVMAHPFAASRGRTVRDEVIEAMAREGLAGLEAHHVDHTPEQEAHAVDLARQLGLFVTGSSDYHGAGKANRLGERLTDPAVLEQIEALGRATPVVRP